MTEALTRLTANTAELAAFATLAGNALAASDYNALGNALGKLTSTAAQCFDDALSLAPDPQAAQRAYDDGMAGG